MTETEHFLWFEPAVPAVAVVLGVAAIWLAVRLVRSGRRGPSLAPGLVTLATGLPLTAAAPAFSFGWFAYAPLSSQVYLPSPSPWAVAGVILLTGGALALGVALGARLASGR